MKITRIEAENFIGAKSVDLKLSAPITLISGGNAAGKSSIYEAVRMALTGETVRVSLKKEYDQLVTNNAKAGGALVTTDLGSASFSLPKGEAQRDEALPQGDILATLIDAQRLASFDDKTRRSFILSVSGKRANVDTVKTRLLERECDAGMTEQVLPMLRTGFAGACDYAKDEAKKLKGAWKQITSANYGTKAAESWKAEKPEAVVTKYSQADLVALNGQIGDINQQIGALRSEQSAFNANKSRIDALKSDAEQLEKRKEYLAMTEADITEYLPALEELRAKALGRKVGLVHDMAHIMVRMRRHAELPAKLASDYTDVRNEYEKQFGLIVDQDADPAAQAALPEHEKGLVTLQNRAANLKRDIERSEHAKEELVSLNVPGEAVDYDGQIAALNQKKLALSQSLEKIKAELAYVNQITLQIQSADKKTADALATHNQITEWLKIADALSPEGIPSELLTEALLPINQALTSAAAHSGWQSVYIDNDVNITYGQRAYPLLSESEKWRVDAMIAYAVATVSGLRFMLLDRMDVLEPKARGQFLTWLHTLAEENLIDTVITFATLKAPASGLPDTISQFWIESGVYKELREAA